MYHLPNLRPTYVCLSLNRAVIRSLLRDSAIFTEPECVTMWLITHRLIGQKSCVICWITVRCNMCINIIIMCLWVNVEFYSRRTNQYDAFWRGGIMLRLLEFCSWRYRCSGENVCLRRLHGDCNYTTQLNVPSCRDMPELVPEFFFINKNSYSDFLLQFPFFI